MNELRDDAEYDEITRIAGEDGAAAMKTLLEHVGYNRPSKLLTIYKGTSLKGRQAFAAVGFTEEGPTGAPMPEVLARAARWSTAHGFDRLAQRLARFINMTWPGDAAGVSGNPLHVVSVPPPDDVIAETREIDEAEVREFASRVDAGDFAVADQHVTAKTRGSAQRVFAARVKGNYGWRCAITGLATPEFLVASHIVPWAEDELIRLDPANGICLSTFVDRAFDTGFLKIYEDYGIHIDWQRVGPDAALRAALEQYDGRTLTLPTASQPNPEFLLRRLG